MSPLLSTRLRRGSLVVGAAAAVALAIPTISAAQPAAQTAHPASASAPAASTKRPVSQVDRIILTGGGTTLALDATTAAALKTNKITVTPTSEAFVGTSGIVFPITAGLIKPQTLVGTVEHSGGLTFSAGGKDLTVRDFTIDTGKKQLLAYVEELKTTVPLLDLDLSGLTTSLTSTTVTLSGVKATLDATAATALDTYYKTTLFTAGLPIGVASTSANYVGVLVNR